MKPRPTQFGIRENTASLRQHASRLATTTRQSEPSKRFLAVHHEDETQPSLSPMNGATVGEGKDQLLTVHEVAQVLHVSVSWVYEYTRPTCADRIPSLRLGKYLRFIEADITAWLIERRTKK